jgi:dsDNA-specific endonuclease/ATPase MutS2
MNKKILESEDDKAKHSIFQLIHKKSNSQLPALNERLNLMQTLSRYENMVNSIKFKKTMNIPAPSAPTLRKIMTEKNLLQPIEKKVNVESVTKRLYPDVKAYCTMREVPQAKRGPFVSHMKNLSCLQPTKSFLCKTIKSERNLRESFSPKLPRLSRNDTLSDSLTQRINQARSKAKILCELYKDKSNPEYNNSTRNKYKSLV